MNLRIKEFIKYVQKVHPNIFNLKEIYKAQFGFLKEDAKKFLDSIKNIPIYIIVFFPPLHFLILAFCLFVEYCKFLKNKGKFIFKEGEIND